MVLRNRHFVEEIFPFVIYFKNYKKLILKLNKVSILEEKGLTEYETIAIDKLQLRLCEERKRAVAIDNKTARMSLWVSLGLTVLSSSSALFVEQIPYLLARIIFLMLVGFGFLYFFVSSYIALGSLKTLPSYGFGTQVLLIKNNRQLQRKLADWLARSESVNSIRHIRNESTYQTIRNGLLLMGLAIIVLLVSYGIEMISDNLLSEALKLKEPAKED